ncbi:probable cytochrome P450 6a21 isoform X3 [Bactrocera dorsalis]|uniref:Probable cytochrome P450 6a21 isoform X2 n=1 Tax=Bactrocera dorsalis TaxID=27457 RepID=A0ABM3JE03_BACDO|nr:probable cytochrome P450 6a21 isoform X2 [Bactrocera dorsalis]XP_049307460.1 probable cytochrome P450 6a21 isoform X3 [Bactrocera dorsalis]
MAITQILLLLVLGLVSYFAYWFRKRMNTWQDLGIACDKPNYLLGNLVGMRKTRSFADIGRSTYSKFKGTGPFCGFYWFHRPAVFVLETSLAKAVLIKEFNKFTDRGFYTNPDDDPLSGHLFALDGHKWRAMRNKLSPTFTSGKMKQMFPTVTRVAAELVNVYNEAVNGERRSTLEVRDSLGRYTTDVIGSCAFGIDCNSLKNPNDPFRQMGRRVFTDQRHGPLALALIILFPKLSRRLHIKITPDHITDFYMRIVRENIAYREANNIKRHDFFDMLMDLKNNKMMKSEDGQAMMNITVEELAAQAFVFMVAGFETSSTTMGFALYELAQREDLQQRARQEVVEVLQKHNGEFTYECMNEMVYLNQVISETLRKHTILPLLVRECLEDYQVPDQPKYEIKKGTLVIIPAVGIHYDEDYYPNPEEFNPDHFTPEKVALRDSIEWLPFGDGPRNCIGLRFGLMQTRVGLAYLLENFKFSVSRKHRFPSKIRKKTKSFVEMAEGDTNLHER